jgi:acyl-CoA synthetase (AMP-forming)/AMP-acid ligase II
VRSQESNVPDPRPGTLEFAVLQNPGAEAVVDGDVRWTYAGWDEIARRLGVFLRDRYGIGPGDRVAWMLTNRRE